jgi:Na+-translocating ferredoxin:NAD+ oxidoreductase RnfD subunit
MVFLFYLKGDRIINSILPILFFGFVLDMILTKWRRGNFEFPVSGLITAIACIMLMKTQYILYPYFIAISVGLFSKIYFKDKFGHYFNPANIGLLVVIFTMPQLAGIFASQWVVNPWLYAIMFGVGFIISYMNSRIVITLSYLFTLILLRFIWAKNNSINLEFYLGAILNTATLIFSCHMITDPKTSPKVWQGQLFFGISIGLLDFIFRLNSMVFAPIFALCLLSAIYNPWREKFIFFRST